MRKKEREITDRDKIDQVIRSCQVCRIAMVDGDTPYVVPLCFGYDGKALYFHSATEGRKTDILARNCKVCVEFDIADGLKKADQACSWGIRYRSVVAHGLVSEIQGTEEKRKALGIIMAQYSEQAFTYPEPIVNQTAVFKIEVETLTGKQSL